MGTFVLYYLRNFLLEYSIFFNFYEKFLLNYYYLHLVGIIISTMTVIVRKRKRNIQNSFHIIRHNINIHKSENTQCTATILAGITNTGSYLHNIL